MSGKKLKKFQPLAVISKDWEEWFIEKYNVKICDIYYPPYNFKRTGCKGCPFALNLQKELDTLEKYYPKERKQCEIVWKPVYDEYRRLGYRLKDKKTKQMSILDYLEEK
jgi:3'-phosphoadenosine 5'-phosphosulfate sulfotransferase (PAPS reductase)/FAD synthetase